MDCIILAGNRENYREVSHENNKAFLKVGDQSILQMMIEELYRVPEIDRLLVVGPKQQLEDHLKLAERESQPKPVLIFEQKNDLVENVLAVFSATEESQPNDRAALILPSDIPLLIAEEVREFIGQCDITRFDYVGGLTTEKALSRFYPQNGKPGVVMSYFYCQKQGYRINNMHMVRPAGIRRMAYIRKTYGMRYQNNPLNILKMIGHLIGGFIRSPGAFPFYLGLQLARLFHAWQWRGLAHMVQRRLTIDRLALHIGKLLGTRLKIVATRFGGSAIDVDNEDDYHAIVERHREWIAMQKALARETDIH